jgi:hypothetical protein
LGKYKEKVKKEILEKCSLADIVAVDISKPCLQYNNHLKKYPDGAFRRYCCEIHVNHNLLKSALRVLI